MDGQSQERPPSQTITVLCAAREIHFGGGVFRCAIGKNGYVPFDQGREGDGKTPLGTYPLRNGFYRADRIACPETKLIMRPLREDDGWCDDKGDPAYNRPVRLPYPASAEKMCRDDEAYDICLVLGHNDDPPEPGRGSAIFLHLMKKNYQPTLGCVAVNYEDMLEILKTVDSQADICIKA